MSDEPDLLTRGDALATRLQERSRGHVIMDATMRKMAAAASLTGEPMALDDRDARAGLEFARDATTVRRLVERAVGQERKPRGPVFVGLVGSCIMLVAMIAVASAIFFYRQSPVLMIPIILGGPLLGWALTVLPVRR